MTPMPFTAFHCGSPCGMGRTGTRISRLLILSAILLALIWPQAGAAFCYVPGDGGRLPVSFPLFPSPIVVPADAKPGDELAYTSVNPLLRLDKNAVPWPGYRKEATVTGQLVPGMSNVYETGVRGIGVRFETTMNLNGAYGSVPRSDAFYAPPKRDHPNWINARLVVTGPVSSGTTTLSPTFNHSISGACSAPVRYSIKVPAGIVIQAPSSCAWPANGGVPSFSFPASLAVPRDKPVGTVLASRTLELGLRLGLGNYIKRGTVTGRPVSGWSSVFETGVPGIGIKFFNTSWVGETGMTVMPATQYTTQFAPFDGRDLVQADLVVTGPVSGGRITSPPTLNLSMDGCSEPLAFSVGVIAGTEIQSQTCSVISKNLTPRLDPISAKDLGAIGAESGNASFSIGLDCSAGARIHGVFTDVTNPGNLSTNLSLTPDSTAKGVQLRIFHEGKAIAFGPQSTQAGAQSQKFLANSVNGRVDIPLTARYVRTGTKVTPGSVRGNAVFTLSYR